MKRILFSLTLLIAFGSFSAVAQDYDDIYYNPKNDKTEQARNKKKQSYYIKDFENIDVDDYNRRGQYYSTPIDTIGSNAESGEDFVYTQQIQKYYNPTIVVDNANVLGDILENSYGNVEIVFNNGNPYFASSWNWGWPYYSYSWNDPWYWGWHSAWNRPWYWGPSWTWGPSWGWDWSWNWGWGPSWSWGPGWGGWYPSRPIYSHYRPNGRYPNRPGHNWATNTRPGGNSSSGVGRYPGGAHSPSYGNTNIYGGSTNNHHRTYGGSNNSRPDNKTGLNGNSYTGNRGYTINNNGHRTYNNSSNSGRNNNGYTNSNSNNHRSNNSYNNNSNRRSYNNSNYNSGSRSYGGGYSGGNRGGGYSGGGSRGRHR